MKFKPIIAASEDIDTQDAVQEIIEKSLTQLDGQTPKAGIVYFGTETDTELLSKMLLKQWPDLPFIGCSTWGEFSSDIGFTEDGIVLCLFCSDQLDFQAHYIHATQSSDVSELAETFLHDVNNNHSSHPSLCLILNDVIQFHETEPLLEKLNQLMPQTQFFGGAAADALEFKHQQLIFGEQTLKTGCVILSIFGDLNITTDVDIGWSSSVKRGTITRSNKNTLIEVDHKPALDFYTEGFSKPLHPKGELPICLYKPNGQRLFLRSSYDYDKENGHVTFLGRLPEGSTIELTSLTYDSMIKGVENSLNDSILNVQKNKTPPILAIFSSCAARRAIYGSRTLQENEVLNSILANNIPYIGFYTFGEICPNKNKSPAVFHNQTFSTLLIS